MGIAGSIDGCRSRRWALTQAWFPRRKASHAGGAGMASSEARSSLQIVDLILHAVALSLDEYRLGVVQEPVEQRRRQGAVIVEYLGPVLERTVRGDDRGAALIARANNLEQAVGAKLVDRKVAELIDDEQRWLQIFVHFTLEAARCLRSGK